MPTYLVTGIVSLGLGAGPALAVPGKASPPSARTDVVLEWFDATNSALSAAGLGTAGKHPGHRPIDPDPAWTPFLATPAHPEYPSGHTTFAEAAEVLLTSPIGPRRARRSR